MLRNVKDRSRMRDEERSCFPSDLEAIRVSKYRGEILMSFPLVSLLANRGKRRELRVIRASCCSLNALKMCPFGHFRFPLFDRKLCCASPIAQALLNVLAFLRTRCSAFPVKGKGARGFEAERFETRACYV